MPSELLTRVQQLINPRVAREVNRYQGTQNQPDVPPAQPTNPNWVPTLNTQPHWAAGIGAVIDPITIIIHGTSGWASYASAMNSGELLKSLDTRLRQWIRNRWTDSRGVGPQFTIDPNGTVLPIIGAENADGDLLLTYHTIGMNEYSIGIEQTDFGNEPATRPPVIANQFLFRLNESPGVGANTEDLAGMKLYAQLHPAEDRRNNVEEDLNLIWIKLDTYTGPGDLTSPHFANWNNSLFTERDYRSLATLSRYLAEDNEIPRNVPTRPYLSRHHHNADAALFRELLLGDPTRDQIAHRMGLNVADAQAGGVTWATAYANAPGTTFDTWRQFFDLPAANNQRGRASYRGFLSHWINGGHPCPGPLFDWHRFAREVWDWWWYPFDFSGTPLQPSGNSRPYRQARGDTRLIEYYYDAVGSVADYASRTTAHTIPLTTKRVERLDIGAHVQVHALANGVVVAARLPIASTGAPGNGFLLTRHEIFTPDATGRITYDNPPTPVWTLIRRLAAPGFRIDQIGPMNPDWLNRLVIRLKECEMAIAYRAANATNHALRRAWRYHPLPPLPTTPPTVRPTTGELVERDAAAYRLLADDLIAGRDVLFPRGVAGAATTVRTILGDFLGTPDLSGGTPTIELEIFSRTQLAVPGAFSSVVSAVGEPWWTGATAAVRHEARANEDLPADGVVWKYPMAEFLAWINGTTWRHEWSKYEAMDHTVTPPVPVPLPGRPNSRTSF